MPTLMKTIAETTQAITRPVVVGALELLKQYTGIDPTVEIQVFTGSNAAPTPGSVLNAGNGDGIRFDSHEKLYADYTESFEENDVATTAINWQDNPPYFLDPALQIAMRAIVAKTTVELSIRYRSPNEASATRWVNTIRQRLSMERTVLPLELNYSYQIPKALLTTVAHLHHLREKVAPYGQTLGEYLTQYFDSRVSVEKNSAGKGQVFVVAERQGGVLAQLEFTTPPQPERNDTNGTWVTSFTLRFVYEKPIGCIMNYPVCVHNQLVSAAFRRDPTPYTLTEHGVVTATRNAYLRLPGVSPRPWQHPLGGIVLPSYDDWYPRALSRNTTSVFTSLIQVDTRDPYQICNLHDLGQYQIRNIFLEWIRDNRWRMFSEIMSPLVLEFYVGNARFNPEALVVDEALNVRSQAPLSEREIHHLRIAIVTDLTALSDPHVKALCADGVVCLEFLKLVDPTLATRGLLPRLRGGKQVAAADFYRTLTAIGTTDPNFRTLPERRRLGVGTFLVQPGA